MGANLCSGAERKRETLFLSCFHCSWWVVLHFVKVSDIRDLVSTDGSSSSLKYHCMCVAIYVGKNYLPKVREKVCKWCSKSVERREVGMGGVYMHLRRRCGGGGLKIYFEHECYQNVYVFIYDSTSPLSDHMSSQGISSDFIKDCYCAQFLCAYTKNCLSSGLYL